MTLNVDEVLNSKYITYYTLVRFQVLTANMKMAVFWDVVCSVLEGYQHFRGACCLYHPDDGGRKHF
jgi:hypothetical protein